MPATRSRTENWRQSLEGILERNGALEITLPRYITSGNTLNENGAPDSPTHNVIWRVRILSINDEEIVVEEPMALGHTFSLEAGIELVAIIAIGQNRWMFRTTNLGKTTAVLNKGVKVGGLRLKMPSDVERCQRRNFYRVSTVGLSLPQVECFPLLDPDTIEIAETASRVQIEDATESAVIATIGKQVDLPVMPHVGPMLPASLMNVGGGGAGLIFEPEDRASLEGNKLYWLRIRLQPHIPAPLGVAARLRHTHIDSTQRVYAGMMFEFGHNAEHQKFVVDQLCRYVALVQREQLRRQTKEIE